MKNGRRNGNFPKQDGTEGSGLPLFSPFSDPDPEKEEQAAVSGTEDDRYFEDFDEIEDFEDLDFSVDPDWLFGGAAPVQEEKEDASAERRALPAGKEADGVFPPEERFRFGAPAGERDPSVESAPAGERDSFGASAPAEERNPSGVSVPAGERDPSGVSAPAGERDPSGESAPAGERDSFGASAPAEENRPAETERPTAAEAVPFSGEPSECFGGSRDFNILFAEKAASAASDPGHAAGPSRADQEKRPFSGPEEIPVSLSDDFLFEADDLDVEISAVPAEERRRTEVPPESEKQEERFYDGTALGRLISGEASEEEALPQEETFDSEEERQAWENNIFWELERKERPHAGAQREPSGGKTDAGRREPSQGAEQAAGAGEKKGEAERAEGAEDAGRAENAEKSTERAEGTEKKQPQKQAPGGGKKGAARTAKKKLTPAQRAKRIGRETVKWAALAAAAIFVVSLLSIYVLRFSIVSGHSMDPTLYDGETIVISKLPYVFGEIERGDIIVIDRQEDRARTFGVELREVLRYSFLVNLFLPEDQEESVFWVKRVIGVEGDVIVFSNGKLYRNGTPVEEEYLYTQNITTYPDTVFVVGEGELFVMGDNRNSSLDSRFLTVPIKADHVVGKVIGLGK